MSGMGGGRSGSSGRRIEANIEDILKNQATQMAWLVEAMSVIAKSLQQREKDIKDIKESIADLYLTGTESNDK